MSTPEFEQAVREMRRLQMLWMGKKVMMVDVTAMQLAERKVDAMLDEMDSRQRKLFTEE